MSLFLQHKFLNDLLVPEILWLHNINDGDGLARPKVSYEGRDNIKVWAGVDVFYGDKASLFGQFNQNDRVVLGAEWGI